MSAGGFTFYKPPQCLIRDSIGHGGVKVGLGQDDDGNELVFLNVGDGYRNDGEILLAADELTVLIDQLTIFRNAMRDRGES